MIPAAIRFLVDGGHSAPSADNSQPWRFVWDGKALSLNFRGSDSVLEVFGADSHAEKLTMGAVTENVDQLVSDMRIGGKWAINPQGEPYFRFTPDSLPEIESFPTSHVVFSRHTNRFTFRRDVLDDSAVNALTALEQSRCQVRCYTQKQDIRRIATLVKHASALRFRNRKIHEWFGRTLRFDDKEVNQGTGLDVATIELPPGGRSLLKLIMEWSRMRQLNRLGMYRMLSMMEAKAINTSPGIIAIVGAEADAFNAGRLLERVWLECERQRISLQPYYVVADQMVRLKQGLLPDELVGEALQLEQAAHSFFGEMDFPHLLFRAGYAKNSPKRAMRLPVADVLIDRSA
jgi:hypothetical protein